MGTSTATATATAASTASSATATRRTQAERTAETRGRLLDAAVECLVELGWAGTSTVEIARRAGVSRGAQLHHFPTKADLVLSALEHLYARRDAEFRDAMTNVPPGRNPAETAVDVLWGFFDGPTFVACLELAVAARTDPELQRRFAELEDRFLRACEETFEAVFPGTPVLAQRFAFAVLDGLALEQLHGSRPGRDPADVLESLKLIARLLMPAVPEGDAP